MSATPNYYVFVSSDADRSRVGLPSAFALALYRMKRGKWGINSGTKHRTRFIRGDKILVYAGGQRPGGMSFVGAATLGSAPLPLKTAERRDTDAPDGLGAVYSDLYVPLQNVRIFRERVAIKPILSQLQLTKNAPMPRWGVVLIGGCVRLSKQDYELVIGRGG